MLESRPRPLGRVASTPHRPRKRPAQFEPGPAIWLIEADAADEGAWRGPLGDGPHPKASKGPLADMHGQRTPRVFRAERIRDTEGACEHGVGVHRRPGRNI